MESSLAFVFLHFLLNAFSRFLLATFGQKLRSKWRTIFVLCWNMI